MSENLPLVSIGIPMYNAREYVRETLDSIAAQTYRNLEIIVIDDGSTDDSNEVVRNWMASNVEIPLRLVKQEKNQGLSKTSNHILKYVNGVYFQKLDADDILLPDKISQQVSLFLKSEKNVALIYAKTHLIDNFSKLIAQSFVDRIEYYHQPTGFVYSDLLNFNFIPQSSTLIRFDVLKEIGGYDESLYFDDWDSWLRISIKYKILFDDNFRCKYRIHPSSMMSDKKKVILCNECNFLTFKKIIESNSIQKERVLKKIKNYSIYAYHLGDSKASEKLFFYLTHKFDFKILLYYVLNKFSISKPRIKKVV